jgi:peptide/nickel transport system permease protein
MSTAESAPKRIPGWRALERAGKIRRLLIGRAVANTSLRLGGGIVVVMVVASVVVSAISVNPNHQNLAVALSTPGSAGHLLGTDPLGRDVLAWIAGGIRVGLLISAAVVVISASVGVTVGVVAGYFGRWVDALLMRIVDMQLAVPPLLLFLAVSAVARPSIPGLIVLLSAVSWVPYARLVRTRIQAERTRGYVAAARLAGSGRSKIVVQHLFPPALSLAGVIASLQAGYVLLWESALSFFGLGVQPPATSLGFMIAQGQNNLTEAWWVVLFPGLTLVLLVFAFNLLGDGLRERLDIGEADIGTAR